MQKGYDENGGHYCPICGKTFFRGEFSYDICLNCGWEDDMDIEDVLTESSANGISILEYRKEYYKNIAEDSNYNWHNYVYGCMLRKGIFWILDLQNLSANSKYLFKIICDCTGRGVETELGFPVNSADNDNYDFVPTWNDYVFIADKSIHTFTDFGLGRVTIADDKAEITISSDIATNEVIEYIKHEFNLIDSHLSDVKVTVKDKHDIV